MHSHKDRHAVDRKCGPPSHVKPRPYNPMLELLEVQGNSKLTEEYSQDIKNYYSSQETSNTVNVAMIDLQPEIQWFMRPFLLDFIIELHSSFRLQSHTLFLCLNIVDRYCSKRIVFKRHYQLVGCTALWIAGKYEDKKSRVPTLKELAMMCRNAYDEDMFIQMERHILATLEWSLGFPSLEDCLQLAITSCKLSSSATPIKYNFNTNGASVVSAVTAIGRFLCELSLYNKYFLGVPTSLVSITSNLLACSMLQLPHAALQLQQLTSDVQNGQAYSQMLGSDEDQENQKPVVEGPFLSGLDGLTLNVIRKCCLCLIVQLSRSTEVLTKKYDDLGVIEVVRNFTIRYSSIIKIINKNETSIEEEPEHNFQESSMSQLADVLLQIPNVNQNLADDFQVPLTPPSASSQFSIFSSDHRETPRNGKYKYNSGYESISDSPSTDLHNVWSSPIPSKMHV